MKIIHCADLHLDSKLESNLDAYKAKERRSEILDTFERMIEYAVNYDVTAIIIAGDMFDTARIKSSTKSRIINTIRKNPQLDLEASIVISKDTSNYYSTFLIDKGLEDGIKTNMPVVGAKGLIGYVAETGKGFSKIQTIIEGGSSVGCVVSRTGNTAVTEGNTVLLKEGLMSMIYVSKEMNLVEGDIVETSGLGQIYPPGLVIGRIKEITTDEITKSQYAIIKPVEDFEFIREVFVITNFEKISR